MSEQNYRVPEKIKHADLMAAMSPLLDLLGVTPLEVYSPIVIDAEVISFAVVARDVGDDSDEPAGTSTCDSPFESPTEFAELAVPIRVKVAL